MFLIISPKVISILFRWDGLGLVSYLLVIYYQIMRFMVLVCFMFCLIVLLMLLC